MFKSISLMLLLTLIGVGGITISAQAYFANQTSINLHNRVYVINNTDFGLDDSSDLFLKANINPSL